MPFIVEIYTDKMAELGRYFAGEPKVKLVPITAEQIKAWRGEIDFVHRVKLKVLELAAQSHQGPLLYLDGDTYFLTHPDQLFAKIDDRNSLMHIRESSLGEAKDILTKKIAKFVKKRNFMVAGESLHIPPSCEMWNAGVIGLSHKNTALFGPMIELTDRTYSEYQKHVMEQLAVSYFIQKNTVVHGADSVVFHYWANKGGFDRAISDFLSKYQDFSSGKHNYSQFSWPPPPPEKKKKRWFFF